jgi:hypothetical protein
MQNLDLKAKINYLSVEVWEPADVRKSECMCVGRCDLKYVKHLFENRIMKPVKIVLKGRERSIRKSNRGDKFDQRTYSHTEISQ